MNKHPKRSLTIIKLVKSINFNTYLNKHNCITNINNKLFKGTSYFKLNKTKQIFYLKDEITIMY